MNAQQGYFWRGAAQANFNQLQIQRGFDMKKALTIIFGLVVVGYLGLYVYFYSVQIDRFKSVKLSSDFKFKFDDPFEELNFKSKDGGQINSLLFKKDCSRGVECFWKGNGGNLDRWGLMAPMFLKCNYDIIITDYRQHGKRREKSRSINSIPTRRQYMFF